MSALRIIDASPRQDARSGRARTDHIGSDRPDVRSEAMLKFPTIFLRPALELRSPLRRIVGAVIDACARLRLGYQGRDRAETPGRDKAEARFQ